MSKPFRSFSLIALLAISSISAIGQDIDATIEINFNAPPIIKVQGRAKNSRGSRNRRNLSFLRAMAGVDNLATRVSNLRLLDSEGKPVAFRKLMDGEYLTDADFDRWEYDIDLTPPKNRNAAAHVSWFAGDIGVLMLADLLPRFDANGQVASARITFQTPGTLNLTMAPIYSSETRREENSYDVPDVNDAIFYIGSSWKNGHSTTNPFYGKLLISGSWNFTSADSSNFAKEIYSYYGKLFGTDSPAPPFIAIAKFPNQVGPGEWQAETRGKNVTIISSDMPFRTQSLQRLHEQLRHELFHLWIPNGVNLTGNYDWFYEGFALYQSLKLAVALNRIRFEDFLDTLSRAHTMDGAQSQRTSLIQASATRFSGSNTQVYARGMLVAFLCDLAMLQQSKGKRSVETLLKELFESHRKPAAPIDGNTAVLALLRSNADLVPVVDTYVTGAEKIEWANDLTAAGIEDSDAGPLTTLRIKEKLNGRQKALLDKLGYNNWRKLTPNSK